MPNEKPQIKIPEKDGTISFQQRAEQRFRDIDVVIKTVMIVVVITVICALIQVVAIVVDQLHFNNQTYREFSDLKKDNIVLMKRISEIENKVDSLSQRITVDQREPNNYITKKR